MTTNKIRVTLDLGYGDFREIEKELSESVVRTALVPLDLPSSTADGFGRFLCSPEAEIRRVMRSREETARVLSRELTDAIVEAMGARDTEMGYPREAGAGEKP